MTGTSRVWLITGVSSGFGLELARAVLGRGDTVVGTVRQAAQVASFESLVPGRAHGRILDVTDAAAIAPLVARIEQEFGPIDVLVNNAGYGLGGAVEELDDAECRHVMETNFFGTLNLIKAVVPYFRRRKSGHIINFSSMAGILGIAGIGLYSASKFAVTGLSEALAGELAPFGIRVTVVEPGGFRTNFAGGSLSLARKPMPEYDGYAGRSAPGHEGALPRHAARRPGQGRGRGDRHRRTQTSRQCTCCWGPTPSPPPVARSPRFGDEISAWEAVSTGTNYSS